MEKQHQENYDIKIVDYQSKYKSAFKALNEEWISKYFEMEEVDFQALDNPDESILAAGGKIFVALYKEEPVGVCALIKREDLLYDHELAKLAVSPKAQGKRIGFLLCQRVINAAKESGASRLYLEGNRILKASIALYKKLGFQEIKERTSSYKRVNIQMELVLESP